MMITKHFKSNLSKDHVMLKYPMIFDGPHKATFIMIMYDNLTEHIKILKQIIAYARNNKIQWILITVFGKYNPPINATIYKKNKELCCHLADFEDFYIFNMNTIIELNKIYVTKKKKKKNGWVFKETLNTKKINKHNKLKTYSRKQYTKKNKSLEDSWDII